MTPPTPTGTSQAGTSSNDSDVEAAMKAQLSNLMFVELLFWHNRPGAEHLQQEYGWRDKARMVMVGNFRGDLGEDEGDGESCRGWGLGGGVSEGRRCSF